MSKKIYIDPGHSNVDPGAVGYVVERDLNEKVAKFMNEYLMATYVCETKVDPITNNSVSQVAANANAWKADLLVSIHFNAGGGDGYEALVYSSARIALGQVFEKHATAIGQNSRGVKLRPGLGVLRLSNMPAVLNEGAFVDNKKDIDDWNEDHELKKLGIAYAEAAAEYLGLDKKTVVQAPVASVPEISSSVQNKEEEKIVGADLYTGAELKLNNVALYSTSTNSTKSSSVSGIYYIWSKTAVNGRIRITNTSANVGKTGRVTGWIKDSDAKNGLLANNTTSSQSTFAPYLVRVTAIPLNIRKGPGSSYGINGTIRDKGTYTIVQESTGTGATKWLKLKSGAGWIASDYTSKV